MKKVFSSFLLIPIGINIISCASDEKKTGTNKFTMESNPHFSYQFELECENGNSSSMVPDFTFTSVSDAKKGTITVSEVSDGFRQKGDSVNLVAIDSKNEKTTYKLNYTEVNDGAASDLLTYKGEITNFPKGSLNFKIEDDLVEQEVELKSRFLFPLDENNQYQAYFASVNFLNQNDFERLGYNAEDELDYISQHLYMKYSHDFGFGTDELLFDTFAGLYMDNPPEDYYKYKQSDNVYLDIYAKDEYLSFFCDCNWSENEVTFINSRHTLYNALSMIDKKIINSDNKKGIRYYFKSPDDMKIIMNFYMMLIPHDLIPVVLTEANMQNSWYQLESVNGSSDNSRKYLLEDQSSCRGYAKTDDFTSANNNQIDIVFSLTQEGINHKNELSSNYEFVVHSGGQATFNPDTNKITVKAKAPYLSDNANYSSSIDLDFRPKVQ